MGIGKAHRYSLFGLLYLSQGAIMSFFTALSGIYLLEHNVPMAKVGIISAIGMLPFVLKVFLGMLSDKVNLFRKGHRVPYIIIGVVGQAVGLVVILFINPGTQFGLYALLVFLTLSFMALYDTCTDGLALDTTPVEEEGTVQSIMVGGRALGVVLISAVIGFIAQRSWAAVFLVLAAITVVPLPLLRGVREPERTPETAFRWSAFRAFGSKVVLAVGMYGLFHSLVTYGANQLVNPFLKTTFGVSTTMAGLYTATWGVGVMIGSQVGGQMADRWGRRRSALASVFIGSLGVASLALTQSAAQAWLMVLLFGVGFGAYSTVFFALSMSVCEAAISASMYAILMAMANLGSGIGLALTGVLVDTPSVGYRGTFVVLALANALVLATLPVIFGKRRQQIAEPAE